MAARASRRAPSSLSHRHHNLSSTSSTLLFLRRIASAYTAQRTSSSYDAAIPIDTSLAALIGTPEHRTTPFSRKSYRTYGCKRCLAHNTNEAALETNNMQQPPSQPRAYSQAYLPNGGPQPSGPVPGARPLDPNQGRVQQVGHARVLCIADVRGMKRWAYPSCHELKLTLSARQPSPAERACAQCKSRLHHSYR